MNEILATLGWLVNSFPQGSPWPVIIFTTPGGIPASSTHLPKASIAADACSDAFKTIVFPAAKAGPIFTATRNNCEFHGTIAATTPNGSLFVNTNKSGLSIGNVWPETLSAHPAKKLKNCEIYFACHLVSFNIFPVSMVSILPNSSDLLASISANFLRCSPLSVGVIFDHGPSINAL